jgi:hypothetical protein
MLQLCPVFSFARAVGLVERAVGDLCTDIRGLEIYRRFDQGAGGGGSWFAFESLPCHRGDSWMPMEAL